MKGRRGGLGSTGGRFCTRSGGRPMRNGTNGAVGGIRRDRVRGIAVGALGDARRMQTAELPEGAGTEKCDPSAPAIIATLRYREGLPWSRLETAVDAAASRVSIREEIPVALDFLRGLIALGLVGSSVSYSYSYSYSIDSLAEVCVRRIDRVSSDGLRHQAGSPRRLDSSSGLFRVRVP